MEKLRAELLELDKKRKDMEEQIEAIVNYLESDGNPGVKGSLIDDEGFPLPNIDHYRIREERGKLARLQNDLKQIMKVIEEKMSLFFGQAKQEKKSQEQDEEIDKKEPIEIEVKDAPNTENYHLDSDLKKEPFAKVVEVTKGSPAEEAGLLPEDAITVFNGELFKGSSSNPLQTLARIANEKINQTIPIKVLRKDNHGIIQMISLNLVPHTWSGRGILGCKLNLL